MAFVINPLFQSSTVADAPARAQPHSPSDQKTVLVVRSELLPYSETFVKEQAQAYTRWRPVFVGLKRVPGLPVEDLNIQLLPSTTSLPGRAYRKLLRSLRIAPPGIRRRLLPQSASLIHVHLAPTRWIIGIGSAASMFRSL